ncbi:MAG: NAD-dependent epimerase/dehydratase family protein, partial [Elusimicrobia bacterium]|nr:NAD-dependent epimerase/dehydratase family protein [Elusimicrobiota bacterium]
MRYLVTGGAGFIGSNIALELEKLGAQATILDDFSSGNFKTIAGFKGDVIAQSICEPLPFIKEKFDAIFHQAAITDTTVADQKKMMEVNVEGFKNILYFALETGVSRVVYASSAGVYGNLPCPMRETDAPAPENIYGFSKAVMDNVAQVFAKEHKNITLVGLRYFNVYGPGESYKGKAASMIYQLYLQMKAGKNPRVFKHGEQERDFIYVKDVVR